MLIYDRKEQMLKAWMEFVEQGHINKKWVRREIEDSWRRSRSRGIDSCVETVPYLVEPAELEQRREANRELLEISFPIMKNLFSFVEGSGFMVALVDQDGIILQSLGDRETMSLASRNRLVAGASLNEAASGTNATGLVLKQGRPLQVFATEHYIKALHPWTCSSGPIYGHSGQLVGALSITGTFEKVHSHTLGMVVAAIDSIEGQLKVNKVLENLLVVNRYQNAIVESISDGLIAVDEKARVTKINAAAATLLKINPDSVIHSSINELLGYHNPILKSLQTGDICTDEEFHADGKIHCTMTCRPIRNPQQKIVGVVTVVREIRAVKQLVTRMVGARARFTFDDLIGRNATYLKTVEMARTAANSSSNVMLLGESGTGKEVFAQAIHNASSRAKGPFIAINCAALPRELIGSELFGYNEGAFTGAKRGGSPGKFELADGGTLFFDEIGEMPLELQANLLRVLQEKAVVRIGGDQVINVDVRVIVATNKNLHREVEKGAFRSDLFYRLNVLTINMVSLRNRKDDILPLTGFFVEKVNARLGKNAVIIAPETLDYLQRYHWPGNIRQLENVIERAVHIASGEDITPDCLPDEVLSDTRIHLVSSVPGAAQEETKPNSDVVVRKSGKKANRIDILKAIKNNDGNLTHAAKELRISRSTLYRKMDKYSIKVVETESVLPEMHWSRPFIEVANERFCFDDNK
ncbi:sigma-54-dependent Fis family transcriptional regulator [Phosphitispora sp. TUW77]|uniref:sigma-54-dependent Fis family transcriptional regulator n=1 Tax=Phosphitispora sp. TUW77 TaxID=3152361 RepID=UPI003AB7C692